ncbi:protein YLS9-like isoform X1 [Hibiscus syriacus]|uniref:Protein YLS9-like isoform X1 n=1 Tax=Hibiscus syriacus TaxID=106335 RepID=A0A6A3B862_HIBSY|nr:NDR1/HIN1-like protein 12 [Hibiscus syriacus]KAE8711452.1 protein YLS9-like isoform X1 [Hibiscus syriacus]
MTAEYCSHHNNGNQLMKGVSIAIVGFLILSGIVILLVWAILHPSKPSFLLQDVTIYGFNLTAPNLLTSNLQITLASRNPNKRIGIYYQKLDVFGSYHNQKITLPTLLPRTYQGHRDITIWSPVLYGDAVPVAPFLEAALTGDMNGGGLVMLDIKVFGKVKWKVGSWISGRYQINVHCPAYISFTERIMGFQVGSSMNYHLLQTCKVDISR